MLLRKLARLLRPDEPPEPDFASGHALLEGGRIQEAAAIANTLCASAASLANGHYLRALIAEREERLPEAMDEARTAIRAEPVEPAYRLQLAEWLFSSGDYTGAALEYEAALGIPGNPFARDPLVLFKAAGACERARMLEQAQMRLEQALQVRPDFVEAQVNLAALVAGTGDAKRARGLIDKVRPQSAALRLRRALYLPAVYHSRDHIRETLADFEKNIDALLAESAFVLRQPEIEIGLTPFRLAYLGEDVLPALRKLAALVRKAYPVAPPPEAFRRSGKRLRVGFVSTCFCHHSVGRAALPIVEGLDRERFEVVVFAIDPGKDDINLRFRRSADRYIELPRSVSMIANAIREAAPEALVFTDVGMDPVTYFLAFWRLAPVQCVLAGHPITSGIDTLDAFASGDEVEAPDAQAHYSERLWRIPGFFLSIADPPQPQPQARVTRSHYCCPQLPFKLHPDFDDVLAGILERDPQATITLFDDPGPFAGNAIRARLKHRLGDQARRIELLPRLGYADYLSLLSTMPVILDPLHFGGGNTTLEALALGVPVVTLPTSFLRGRFAYGCYRLMDVPDCVAQDREAYAKTAVRIAREPDLREEFSARIRAANARLFDLHGALRGFEAQLVQAVDQTLTDRCG